MLYICYTYNIYNRYITYLLLYENGEEGKWEAAVVQMMIGWIAPCGNRALLWNSRQPS